MNLKDMYTGTLIRSVKPYRNEAFYMVTNITKDEFTAIYISSKYGFNCNYGDTGHKIPRDAAEHFEVVSTPKLIWLVCVGLFSNVINRRSRNGI